MTTPTAATAVPTPSITNLLPRAVDLAIERGDLPPVKQLTTTLKIGAPKARLVRDALARVNWETVRLVTDSQSSENADHVRRLALKTVSGEDETGPAPHLHIVPDVTSDVPQDPQTQATGSNDLGDAVPVPSEPVPDDHPADAGSTAPAAPDALALTNGEPGQVAVEISETTHEAEGEPTATVAQTTHRPVVWPVLILCLPAFVAIWGGWVEMGRLTGFGRVTLLPGISDFQLDTAITLPIGVETYAAYALYVWLSGRVNDTARKFARASAITSLVLGGAGQITYHLMASAGWDTAPWPITALVACIPVAVLGMGAALAHLMHADQH
jgi:hypothetical protein